MIERIMSFFSLMMEIGVFGKRYGKIIRIYGWACFQEHSNCIM